MVTWAINRAFLQELKDVNPDYELAQERLAQWLSSATTLLEFVRKTDLVPKTDLTPLSELVPLLRQVRQELQRQFLLEETYGYLQTPVIHSLTYSTQVEAAYQQHRMLYLMASEMSEAAEMAEYQGKLVERFPYFVMEVQRLQTLWSEHEQNERRLIFEVR